MFLLDLGSLFGKNTTEVLLCPWCVTPRGTWYLFHSEAFCVETVLMVLGTVTSVYLDSLTVGILLSICSHKKAALCSAFSPIR